MSMNVNSAYTMQMQEAEYVNGYTAKNAKRKEKTEEITKQKEPSNIAQKNEDKLSEKAQNYLNNLRKKYGDYDFFIGNSTDELRELSKCGSKEFSVIFSKDEIERMATDEKYAAEKMQGVEGAVNMCRKICEEQGYVSAFDAFNAGNGTVNKVGIVSDDNGNMKLFAELEKTNEKQKERLEKSREKKAEAKKAEEKKASKKNPYEKKEEKTVKRTTVEASSMEELIEKIKNVDWDSVPESKSGDKFNFQA